MILLNSREDEMVDDCLSKDHDVTKNPIVTNGLHQCYQFGFDSLRLI